MNNRSGEKKKRFGSVAAGVVITVFAALLIMMFLPIEEAQAASSVSIQSINYDNSTITVKLGAEDSILLISDGKQKKWETMPLEIAADRTVEMDISWISLAKSYELSLRGDVSTEPISVTIPKQATNLKATYNTYTGLVTFVNAEDEIEWRKKESLTWNKVPEDEETFRNSLLALCANGASVVFRNAGENGTNEYNPGRRPGKEVLVTIPKKSAAPAIKIDDEKLTIAVTKELQYRYADEKSNPTSTDWNNILRNEDMPLALIAPNTMIGSDGDDTKTQTTYIQFRTRATSSKQVSNITTIELPAQKDISDNSKHKVSLAYTSSTTFEIRIPFAGAETPYEYCIINTDDLADGITIDNIDELTWKCVNSTSPVPVSRDKDNVKDGSLIYVRRKAYKSLGEADYKLASPAFKVAEVNYPGEVSTADGSLTWLQTIAGKCNAGNPDGYLTFSLFSPTESTITEIKFVDYASTSTVRATLSASSNDFKSVVAKNSDTGDADKKYIITTTIMTTEKLDGFAEDDDTRRMLANITLEDSTEAFESSDEKGIGLYILPASKVNNPSGATLRSDKLDIAAKLSWTDYDPDSDIIEYTKSFKRVYSSNKKYKKGDSYYGVEGNYDADSFRVRIDFGTRCIADSKCGNFTSTPVMVEKIVYDSVAFRADDTDPAFTVEYADTTNKYNEETRMAVLTIDVSKIEQSPYVDDRNKNTALIIYLSNGEILKNDITINLTETASISGTSNSWTVTEGTLTEEDTVTTTVDGVTTTTKKNHVDRTITLDVFESGYDVSLTSVTWNGISICTNISKQNDKITMDISNKAVNAIDVESSESYYLVFTFDNGFTLKTGWKLTINPTVISH